MTAPAQRGASTTSGRFIVGLVFVIFFVISFLTNILGPLVPDIISGFKVSLAMAAWKAHRSPDPLQPAATVQYSHLRHLVTRADIWPS